MSSSFYVWDIKQHHPDVEINDLEQAEYYATIHRIKDTAII
jgi:hypothetical protein